MKIWIATLALVAGCLIVSPAKSDATKEWCVAEKAEAMEFIVKAVKTGAVRVELTKQETQIYLAGLREMTDVPELPNTIAIIVYVPGNHFALGFLFNDTHKCGEFRLPQRSHEIFLKRAQGEKV